MHTEEQLIQRIARGLESARYRGHVRLGLGDDAAAIAPKRKSNLLVSCDSFIEDTHFLPSTPADSVGYKALVRAASDLVAMGARPTFFLLSLALPKARTGQWLTGFVRGMRRAARLLEMRILGGDTTCSRLIAIGITVLGETPAGRFITRRGAKPGDAIYVSGRLGRAALGLELILRGSGTRRQFKSLLQPHLYPVIRARLGEWLCRNRVASAMMDISDGISTDLPRLCAASGVGARLWTPRMPCVRIPFALARVAPKLRLDPVRMALDGGDDYELLFTVPRARENRLAHAHGFSEMAKVGEITRDRGILIVSEDGTSRPLKPRGWDPFRKESKKG